MSSNILWRFSVWIKCIFFCRGSALKTLKHKFIVNMLDFCWDDQFIYIVMEHCNSGDLSTYIRKRKALPEHLARIFCQQLCSALLFMRKQNIRQGLGEPRRKHALVYGTVPVRDRVPVPSGMYQSCGSVTFWYGSGSADPCLWLMDPDPDPTIFVPDLQDANTKVKTNAKFFRLLFFEGTFISFSNLIVKSLRSWRNKSKSCLKSSILRMFWYTCIKIMRKF